MFFIILHSTKPSFQTTSNDIMLLFGQQWTLPRFYCIISQYKGGGIIGRHQRIKNHYRWNSHGKRTHGQSVFPFQYYLEDIWDFDFHTIGWHWHQEIEFIYVQSGEVQCYIGKDNFSLPAGSGLFINTKVIHQLTAKQTTLIPNIVFSFAVGFRGEFDIPAIY